MRIALLGPTVGQTRRGYERFLTDLYQQLSPLLDVTLFKGAGLADAGEVVVRHVTRTGVLSRVFRQRLRYRRYQLEFASFALAVAPHLTRSDFDIVHFIDPPLAPWLYWIRRISRRRFRLLFTDAGPAAFDASPWVDHVHCLTPRAFASRQTLAADAHRATMLPVGTGVATVDRLERRQALRAKWGIASDTFVVLSVTSFNRHHKRVDHLIAEAVRLEGDFLLWIDGNVYPDGEPELIDIASASLGTKFRHTSVRSEQVAELYAVADVMVSTSLDESFGMALVEAACSGLTVVAHDSDHFRWLLGDVARRVDMSAPGELTGALDELRRRRTPAPSTPGAGSIRQRFGWERLRERYAAMYEQVYEAGA